MKIRRLQVVSDRKEARSSISLGEKKKKKKCLMRIED
jgi:hypothetical protein